MATLIDGKVTYQGGETLPTPGTLAYQQASSGIIPTTTPDPISAPNVGNSSPLVIPNVSNPRVASYQQYLNGKNASIPGYVPLAIDGKFGPLTEAASHLNPAPIPAATPASTGIAASTTTPDPILSTIKDLLTQQGLISDQQGANAGNSQGLFGGAVEQNSKLLDAKSSAIDTKIKNLEDFYKFNQSTLTNPQKTALQATIAKQKSDADELSSAKSYAYRAAVEAGDSPDVLNKIASANDVASVYGAINGTVTKKKTGDGGISIKPTQTQLSQGTQKLQESRGEDGFVDPNVYKDSYNGWISKGWSSASFLKQFPPDQWVNPANTFLPAFLRPKAKTSSGSSSGGGRSI